MHSSVFVLLLAWNPASCFARLNLKSRAPVTKGDLAKRDNELVPGCTEDEHERYKIILCGETLTKCELDWCHQYAHEWKLSLEPATRLAAQRLKSEQHTA